MCFNLWEDFLLAKRGEKKVWSMACSKVIFNTMAPLFFQINLRKKMKSLQFLQMLTCCAIWLEPTKATHPLFVQNSHLFWTMISCLDTMIQTVHSHPSQCFLVTPLILMARYINICLNCLYPLIMKGLSNDCFVDLLQYAIFGKVNKGDETLQKLEQLPTRREGIFVMVLILS